MKINFNTEIVNKIKLKSAKIVNYGEKQELATSLKQRIHLWMQPKNYRYITITRVTIQWAPTVSHLMGSATLTIKLSDSRSSRISRARGDLAIFSLAAKDRFTIDIPTAITVPRKELTNGLPLSISLVLSSLSAKSQVEIGSLEICASVIGEKYAVPTKIDKPVITVESGEEVKERADYWLGMDRLPTQNETIQRMIENYLAGSGTLESLTDSIYKVITTSN
ncbi:TPA_asm: P3 [Lupinus gammacytorhabdovirus 1]|nr:TPA_asm: P3 [Lupinus gammacytorhabdovirus 1]